MSLRLVGAATLLALPAGASAENWRVASADEQSVQYIDADTIDRSGERIRFIREIRLDRPQFVEGFRFDRVIQLAEVSCSQRLLYPLSTTAWLDDRQVHSEGPWDDAEAMRPGTNLGGTHDAVCSNRWASGSIADRAAENARTESDRRKGRPY